MTPQRKAERKQVRDLRKARDQSGIDQFHRLSLKAGTGKLCRCGQDLAGCLADKETCPIRAPKGD